jgi:hypothetical protein
LSLILSGSDGLSDIDGTAATPAIRGTDANTGIFFPAADTIAFSEGGTEAMRINSSGQVGIGCTPVANLQVNASSDVGVAMSNSSSVTSGNRGTISMFNSGTSTVGYIRFGAVTDNVGTDLQFATRPAGGSVTEAMRIDSSGNLLVNTTSTLGTTWINLNGVTSAKNGIGIKNGTDTGTIYSLFIYNSNSSLIGSINNNGSATSFTTSSDYRLKENIAPMTGALAKVELLKPVTYNWKAGGSSQGFIAHELQEVVPDCVSGEKDAVETYTDEDGNEQTRIKAQGIDTSFLVATLTAAIQELKATVDAQAARIAALENPPAPTPIES